MDNILLKKFYKNQCTEEEKQIVYQWLIDADNKKEVTAFLKNEWKESDDKITGGTDFVDLFQKVLSKKVNGKKIQSSPIFDSKSTTFLAQHGESLKLHVINPKNAFGSLSSRRYRLGAAIICIFLIGALIYKLFDTPIISHKTAFGETKIIILPDSSIAMLNANSKLEYSSEWSNQSKTLDKTREVILEGEAFFNVKRRMLTEGNNTKFIVHTKNIDIEVLGTKFNINNRRGRTIIVLESGEVKLNTYDQESNGQEMIMEPGELVDFSLSKKVLHKKQVDPEIYTSWINGLLVFENTPLAEIFQLIEDNYGYQIILKDESILNKLYTDSTSANDIDLLLSKLGIIYNLKITRKENQILIETRTD